PRGPGGRPLRRAGWAARRAAAFRRARGARRRLAHGVRRSVGGAAAGRGGGPPGARHARSDRDRVTVRGRRRACVPGRGDALPVGAGTPEGYAVGGVVGAGVALALASQHVFGMVKESCALLGVFAGLLSATLGVPLLKWQRRRNEGLARWCEDAIRAGHTGA